MRKLFSTILSTSALALVAVPVAAQTTMPLAISADLAGRGATGDFEGTITGDELCYTLSTSGLPGAQNPRIVSNNQARQIQLLPITQNASEGCLRISPQTARLIERNASNYRVVVDAGSGSSGLEGQLR